MFGHPASRGLTLVQQAPHAPWRPTSPSTAIPSFASIPPSSHEDAIDARQRTRAALATAPFSEMCPMSNVFISDRWTAGCCAGFARAKKQRVATADDVLPPTSLLPGDARLAQDHYPVCDRPKAPTLTRVASSTATLSVVRTLHCTPGAIAPVPPPRSTQATLPLLVDRFSACRGDVNLDTAVLTAVEALAQRRIGHAPHRIHLAFGGALDLVDLALTVAACAIEDLDVRGSASPFYTALLHHNTHPPWALVVSRSVPDMKPWATSAAKTPGQINLRAYQGPDRSAVLREMKDGTSAARVVLTTSRLLCKNMDDFAAMPPPGLVVFDGDGALHPRRSRGARSLFNELVDAASWAEAPPLLYVSSAPGAKPLKATCVAAGVPSTWINARTTRLKRELANIGVLSVWSAGSMVLAPTTHRERYVPVGREGGALLTSVMRVTELVIGAYKAGKVDVAHAVMVVLRQLLAHPLLMCGEHGSQDVDVDALTRPRAEGISVVASLRAKLAENLGETLSGGDPLLAALVAALSGRRGNAVVFSTWLPLLRAFAPMLEKAFPEAKVVLWNGAQASKRRTTILRHFSPSPSPSPTRAILLTTISAVAGTPSLAHNTEDVVFLNKPIDPKLRQLAEERVCRVDQTRAVTVTTFLRGVNASRVASIAPKLLVGELGTPMLPTFDSVLAMVTPHTSLPKSVVWRDTTACLDQTMISKTIIGSLAKTLLLARHARVPGVLLVPQRTPAPSTVCTADA